MYSVLNLIHFYIINTGVPLGSVLCSHFIYINGIAYTSDTRESISYADATIPSSVMNCSGLTGQ